MVNDWAQYATIGGIPIPTAPDLARMHSDRMRLLQEQLEGHGLDGIVLLGSSGVAYATGAQTPADDSGRAGLFRSVAIVVKGDTDPFLYSVAWDGAPERLPSDHLFGPLFPDLDDGIDAMRDVIHQHFKLGSRVGVDEQTHPMLRALGDFEWIDARPVMSACKLHKTPDEISAIRAAQFMSEAAMDATRVMLRPGIRQTDLTATYLRNVTECEGTSLALDPIWQVMEPTRAANPWTTHGDLAYPTTSTDRILREGDIIWVDAGTTYYGLSSDFGRTWITSLHPTPTTRQAAQFEQWCAVVNAARSLAKPGVTGLELCRAGIAANDGVKPWLEHFYLAHGIGTDSAEMPLIGTDLGEQFDEKLVLEPGMILVFEPVIWDEGHGGYRAEDIVAITDDGWVPLSNNRYEPFGVTP